MSRSIRHLAAAVALASLAAAGLPLHAQSGARAEAGAVGTLVVAHGANAEWNNYVREVVREARLPGPVEVSFLMGPEAAAHRFQDAAARLERAGAAQIVVVPMLISSHSEHAQQVRYLAGATDSIDHALHGMMDHGGIEPAEVSIPIRVAAAIDNSPAMAAILTDRARALATAPDRQAVFLVGHGPNSAEYYAHWMYNLREVADSVKRAGGFRDVRVDVVRDDAPKHVRAEAVLRVRELIAMQHEITGRDVVVVPVLLSRGRISRETFMADLAGLPIVYSGDPLLPDTRLARWLEARVREGAVAGRDSVTSAR